MTGMTNHTIDPNSLADIITRIRDGFIRALELRDKDLPQSAAVEELTATRLANRTILDLESTAKSNTKKIPH